MKTVVILLALAAPVAAQTRTWTNQDLGRPMNEWEPAPVVKPETLEGFRQRQFVPPISVSAEDRVNVIVRSAPDAGPFGSFRYPRQPDEQLRRFTSGLPMRGYRGRTLTSSVDLERQFAALPHSAGSAQSIELVSRVRDFEAHVSIHQRGFAPTHFPIADRGANNPIIGRHR